MSIRNLEHFFRVTAYFKRMSFLTDFTPATVRVTSTALFSAACELTKPLSCDPPSRAVERERGNSLALCRLGFVERSSQ